MNRVKYLVLIFLLMAEALSVEAQRVDIKLSSRNPSDREKYAAARLKTKLDALGFDNHKGSKTIVSLGIARDTTGLKTEGFRISRKGHKISIEGRDGSGVIYGADELVDYARLNGNLDISDRVQNPEMKLRGSCVGLQKTYILPGRHVYEYPITPELFPWFYDKQMWIKYLDMLADDRMNSLYLWSGHPFASLVRLKDYPFAVEVDSATFKKNEDIYSFLTSEASKRGIYVIQMFYNIIVSKPFAEHYGIKTQDRNRPITPLLSDYTRKSVAAFIEKYPNVGLLVCLGEAMNTYDDDVKWMTQTIIPGVKDGLKALGRTDEPPLLLRAHDTDPKAVMEASLPLYKNIYTMHKYTGESLTTYQPQGPWAQMHRDLAALGSTHIENVHILANLEPFRWSSPRFVYKTVNAMHNVHHANAIHLYPQASYWDWPYSADKLPGGKRELQLDRDWMWYATWARYAWNCHRDSASERVFWEDTIARKYGISRNEASSVVEAYDQSGEIAPKLLRRFGITEGNRQTLLLGMKCSQLVNPYKYTIYPGFYESCGPTGEKLIEYVDKEYKHLPHVGELPLDIVNQVIEHGSRAVEAIDAVASKVTRQKDEFDRLKNDMHCYNEFAESFGWKVRACRHVLNYKWNKNINELDTAVTLLGKSLDHYRKLVDLTRDTYLYANSMQTAQRRIPIGGDGGHYKHWVEMLPVYEQELSNLKKNIAMLRNPSKIAERVIKPLKKADAKLDGGVTVVKLEKGVRLFSDLDSTVSDLAPELVGQTALVFNSKMQKSDGTKISFSCKQPTNILVGFFRDDQKKYAQAPKLETDASANDYGQAEPVLTSAISINGMPQVNVHQYSFAAGSHTLLLPKGVLLVLGLTAEKCTPRDAALSGDDDAIDWLFY